MECWQHNTNPASSRRCFLRGVTGVSALSAASALPSSSGNGIGFGYSTYGMRSLDVGRAIDTCSRIGYDGVELCLIQGWPTDAEVFGRERRKELRRRLLDRGLAVPALLEALPFLRGLERDTSALRERLKRAIEFANDIALGRPPLVQSVIGGRSAQWESVKEHAVDELRWWAEAGERARTVICFKPHAGHTVDTPAKALWLHDRVESPWLQCVYDYSHFYLQGLSVGESLEPLLPITPYIQVKDSRGTPEKHEYLLPGDGPTDYLELFSILKSEGFHGFVNVEVSGQIHRKPGYDPIGTAELCYKRLAPLFKKARITRPARPA